MESYWIVTDGAGNELARFANEQAAREATFTGEYPDDAEIAFVSAP